MAVKTRHNLGGLEKPSKPIAGASERATTDAPGMPGDDNKPQGRTEELTGFITAAEPTGIPIVNPADLQHPGSGEPRKRRGRKPGSKNAPVQVSPDLGLSDDIPGLVVAGHEFIANLLSVPELEIDDEEAKRVTSAGGKLIAHYSRLRMSETAALWVGFGIVMLSIYLPRAIAWYKRTARPVGPVPTPIRAAAPAPAPAPPPSPAAVFGPQGDSGGEAFGGA
jgi:hypothetical protein